MLAQRFIAGSPRCPLLSSPGVPEGRATTAKASTKFLPPSVTITTSVSCRELTPGAGFDKFDIVPDGTAGATECVPTNLSSDRMTFDIACTGMTQTGTVKPTIDANMASDDAGNGNTASTSTDNSVTYDVSAPLVLTVQPPRTPTIASLSQVTVAFSEPVTGVQAGDLTVEGSAATSRSPSAGPATTYTFSGFAPPGEGVVQMVLSGGSIRDLSNNPFAGDTWTYFLDNNTRPTVMINQAPTQADPTGLAPIWFRAVFSEPVSGFDKTDIVPGGTAGATECVPTNLSSDRMTFDIACTGMTQTGTVVPTIGENKASDGAGNGNTESTSTDNSVTYDVSGPSVLTVQPPRYDPIQKTGIVATLGTVTVEFSEPVTGVQAADLSVAGSPATSRSPSSGPATTYTFGGFAPPGEGVIQVVLSGGSIIDLSSNPFTGDNWTYLKDSLPPQVQTLSGPSPSITREGPVKYSVTFDEIVTGFDSSEDYVLNATDTAAATKGNPSGSGAGPYTIILENIQGDGTLWIRVKAGACIDLAGNANRVSTDSATFKVDNTDPEVLTLSGPSSSITRAGPVTYFVTFNEKVTGFDSFGDIKVINSNGTEAVGTVTVGGSRPEPYAGPYTVTLSGITGDGKLWITISANACVDEAGNGNTSAGPSTAFVVDNTKPTVTISKPSPEITQQGPVTYTVAITDSNPQPCTLTTGAVEVNRTLSATETAVAVSGAGPYTVTLSGITGNGTLGISILPDVCTDKAGNGNVSGGPSATCEVDNTPPKLTISGPTPSKTKRNPVTYTVEYSDKNLNTITLSSNGITLVGEAPDVCAREVSWATDVKRNVTLSKVKGGNRNLRIRIAAGTASDLAGNLALSVDAATAFGFEVPTGDYDTNSNGMDRDIDLRDFAAFQRCFKVEVPGPGDCWDAFEFTADEMIGLDDFVEFWKLLHDEVPPPSP